jgi:lysophospholipid acyltransferase (LPLAT)-like uncharacterized protein
MSDFCKIPSLTLPALNTVIIYVKLFNMHRAYEIVCITSLFFFVISITISNRLIQELQEFHSALEEAKADIVGLWALRFLISQVSYHTFSLGME